MNPSQVCKRNYIVHLKDTEESIYLWAWEFGFRFGSEIHNVEESRIDLIMVGRWFDLCLRNRSRLCYPETNWIVFPENMSQSASLVSESSSLANCMGHPMPADFLLWSTILYTFIHMMGLSLPQAYFLMHSPKHTHKFYPCYISTYISALLESISDSMTVKTVAGMVKTSSTCCLVRGGFKQDTTFHFVSWKNVDRK